MFRISVKNQGDPLVFCLGKGLSHELAKITLSLVLLFHTDQGDIDVILCVKMRYCVIRPSPSDHHHFLHRLNIQACEIPVHQIQIPVPGKTFVLMIIDDISLFVFTICIKHADALVFIQSDFKITARLFITHA